MIADELSGQAAAALSRPERDRSGPQTDRHWNHSWYIWNNTGDTAILRNQHGTTIGSCTYKGTAQGYVYC